MKLALEVAFHLKSDVLDASDVLDLAFSKRSFEAASHWTVDALEALDMALDTTFAPKAREVFWTDIFRPVAYGGIKNAFGCDGVLCSCLFSKGGKGFFPLPSAKVGERDQQRACMVCGRDRCTESASCRGGPSCGLHGIGSAGK